MGAYHLIVRNPFGAYAKGAHIGDEAEVERVLAGPNHGDVVRILPVGDAAVGEQGHEQGAPA